MPDPTLFLLYIGWHSTNQQKKKERISCDFLPFPHIRSIGTNIRQRGDVGGSAKKVGKRIKELERIYGIEHGNNQYGDEKNSCPKIQSQLASDMGMDVRTLQNYKLLADMIPELSDLVDTGIVTILLPTSSRKNYPVQVKPRRFL